MSSILNISVLEGRDLIPKDRTGKSDPYVKIKAGSHKKKTKCITQNLNPIWNETFSFPGVDERTQIVLTVYDRDRFSKDDFMGEVVIPSADIASARTAPLEKSYTLCKRKEKDKVSGEIKVRLSFAPGFTSQSAPQLIISAPTGGHFADDKRSTQTLNEPPKPTTAAELQTAIDEINRKLQSELRNKESLNAMILAYQRTNDQQGLSLVQTQLNETEAEIQRLLVQRSQYEQQLNTLQGVNPSTTATTTTTTTTPTYPQSSYLQPQPQPQQQQQSQSQLQPQPPPQPQSQPTLQVPSVRSLPSLPSNSTPSSMQSGSSEPRSTLLQPQTGVSPHPFHATQVSSQRKSWNVEQSGQLGVPRPQNERRLSGGSALPKFQPPSQPPPPPPPKRPLQKKRVRALYDFPPQYPGELELKEGDVLEVIKQDGEWYEGTHTQTGATGWFPVNYVEEIQ